jgi:hypothetical protein
MTSVCAEHYSRQLGISRIKEESESITMNLALVCYIPLIRRNLSIVWEIDKRHLLSSGVFNDNLQFVTSWQMKITADVWRIDQIRGY